MAPMMPAALPANERPQRRMSDTGNEQIVERIERDGSRWRLVLRQVGWLGQSGLFYSLDEDPAPTEPGSFTPLWFVAHGDRIPDDPDAPVAIDGGM